MKILAIGDVHGDNTWTLATPYFDSHDKIVFIGDYWDSYDLEYVYQKHVFESILDIKDSYPDKVELLLGNHEHHYLRPHEFYAGYQHDKAQEIHEQLVKHLDMFNVAYGFENYLFTHAGLSWEFDEKWECGYDWEEITADQTASMLNHLYRTETGAFDLQRVMMGGNHITEGPLWIRPQVLEYSFSPQGHYQIIGHTAQSGIILKDKYAIIDVNQRPQFLSIDTEAEDQLQILSL